MFKNLLAAIEADLNKIAVEQDKRPYDVPLATQKLKLEELAMDYIKLENRYLQLSGANSIY